MGAALQAKSRVFSRFVSVAFAFATVLIVSPAHAQRHGGGHWGGHGGGQWGGGGIRGGEGGWLGRRGVIDGYPGDFGRYRRDGIGFGGGNYGWPNWDQIFKNQEMRQNEARNRQQTITVPRFVIVTGRASAPPAAAMDRADSGYVFHKRLWLDEEGDRRQGPVYSTSAKILDVSQASADQISPNPRYVRERQGAKEPTSPDRGALTRTPPQQVSTQTPSQQTQTASQNLQSGAPAFQAVAPKSGGFSVVREKLPEGWTVNAASQPAYNDEYVNSRGDRLKLTPYVSGPKIFQYVD